MGLAVGGFEASATKWARTALFSVIMQRVVVNSYRRFGTTNLYRNVGQKLPLLAA